jgi:Na+-translocating ferredoxin:NAD+ oxidoreductase RNF subunit RnfB
MCQAIRCEKCGKAGWRGCGAHVEQVLAGVRASDRCSCPAGATTKSMAETLRDLFAPKR